MCLSVNQMIVPVLRVGAMTEVGRLAFEKHRWVLLMNYAASQFAGGTARSTFVGIWLIPAMSQKVAAPGALAIRYTPALNSIRCIRAVRAA